MYCVTPAFRLIAAAFAMAIIIFANATPASAQGCLPGSLQNTLSQIRAKFGSVRIVSTFRRGAIIAGSGRRSLHASCRAVDFHAPPGKRAAVIAWLRANHRGGLGVYGCKMSHIHIDNGGRYSWNKCIGGRRIAGR